MQQKYETTGIIHDVLPAEQRGQYTIQKIVLEIEGYKRAQYPCFEFFGKNAESASKARKGESATISWELAGNENKGKYYTTLSAWKLTTSGGGGGQPDRGFSRPPEHRDERRSTREDEIDF